MLYFGIQLTLEDSEKTNKNKIVSATKRICLWIVVVGCEKCVAY